MTMWIKEKDFAAYAKGLSVNDYNNPYIKSVDGVDVHIIPDGEKITFRKMDEPDVLYHIGYVGEDVYEGSVTVGGWFPTELVCGCIDGRFDNRTKLGFETGWIPTNGTFGSKNDAFLASKVKVAAQKLIDCGFEVEFV